MLGRAIRTALGALLVLALAVPGLGMAGNGTNGWTAERERERKGFTIWSRQVSGSDYPEYMVELRVDASAEAVWAVLNDYEHEVMPRVEERRVLDREGGGVVIYQRDDCDPYAPREYALRFRVASATEPYELRAELAADSAPAPSEDAVRVLQHHHRWTVRADGDHSVAVLIVHHDPVDIPLALYHKGFLGSMKSMRKALERAAHDHDD
jgi:hypothetical protein